MRSSEQIPKSHQALVRRIAKKMFHRIRERVPLEELISDGYIGYFEAQNRFDASYAPHLDRETVFLSFARRRIEGAILDELRNQDVLSRSYRSEVRRIQNIQTSLSRALKREATRDEVARAANRSVEQVDRLLSCFTISYQPPDAPILTSAPDTSAAADPIGLMEALRVARLLEIALNALNENQQFVVTEYYFHDRKLVSIGHELGLSESRASQILSIALPRLRIAYEEAEKAERLLASERRRRRDQPAHQELLTDEFSATQEALDQLLQSYKTPL